MVVILKKVFIFAGAWVVSSVGLEHYLDRVGVTGSTPVQPTKNQKVGTKCQPFMFIISKKEFLPKSFPLQ